MSTRRKKCRECGKRKMLNQFYKQNSNRDGHENICKACKKIYNRVSRTIPCEVCGKEMYKSNGHTVCLECRNRKQDIRYTIDCKYCVFLEGCRVRVKQTGPEYYDWMPPCFVTSKYHDAYVKEYYEPDQPVP